MGILFSKIDFPIIHRSCIHAQIYLGIKSFNANSTPINLHGSVSSTYYFTGIRGRHLHFEASRLHKALPAAENIDTTERVHSKAVSVYLGSHKEGSGTID